MFFKALVRIRFLPAYFSLARHDPTSQLEESIPA